MSLDDLLNEINEKMKTRDLSDDYLREYGNSTREEIGIGEYAYGITMMPCEWVYEYLSDYKTLLKENEELNKYVIHLTDEQYRTAIDLAQNDINQQWIQKIKDKIEELKGRKMDIVMSPVHNNDEKIEILRKDKIKIETLQELLEGRK